MPSSAGVLETSLLECGMHCTVHLDSHHFEMRNVLLQTGLNSKKFTQLYWNVPRLKKMAVPFVVPFPFVNSAQCIGLCRTTSFTQIHWKVSRLKKMVLPFNAVEGLLRKQAAACLQTPVFWKRREIRFLLDMNCIAGNDNLSVTFIMCMYIWVCYWCKILDNKACQNYFYKYIWIYINLAS